MSWDVEYTNEFEAWWSQLSEGEQESVDASVYLLEKRVPKADKLYDVHLDELRKEGLIKDG